MVDILACQEVQFLERYAAYNTMSLAKWANVRRLFNYATRHYITNNAEWCERLASQLSSYIVHDLSSLLATETMLLHWQGYTELPPQMWVRVAVGVNLDTLDRSRIQQTANYLAKGYIAFSTHIMKSAGLRQDVRFGIASNFMYNISASMSEFVLHQLPIIAERMLEGCGIGLGASRVPANELLDRIQLLNSLRTVVATQSKSGAATATAAAAAAAAAASVTCIDSGSAIANRINTTTTTTATTAATTIITNSSTINVCIYIEVWHADVLTFIDLRRPGGGDGDKLKRARDILCGLWVCDEFMRACHEDDTWYLFDPARHGQLVDLHGIEFGAEYRRLVEAKLYTATIAARDLMGHITATILECGGPSIMFKDTINHYSAQDELGTITTSGPCCDLVQYTSSVHPSVCVLGSIGLPAFATSATSATSAERMSGCAPLNFFNFELMESAVRLLVGRLDHMVGHADRLHRSIGIGYHGLSDVYKVQRIAYDSDRARELNVQIVRHLYVTATDESCRLAHELGPYESCTSSLSASGMFVPELSIGRIVELDAMRKNVQQYGLRNSLRIALMPTVTCSRTTNSSDSFELPLSNAYNYRSRLGGETLVVDRYLLLELKRLKLYTDEVLLKIILNRGSVQSIVELPADLREIYKTAFEVPMQLQLARAVDRQPFVDQSQAISLFFERPTNALIYSALMYAWRKKLKTGMYALRCKLTPTTSRPSSSAAAINAVVVVTSPNAATNAITTPTTTTPIAAAAAAAAAAARSTSTASAPITVLTIRGGGGGGGGGSCSKHHPQSHIYNECD